MLLYYLEVCKVEEFRSHWASTIIFQRIKIFHMHTINQRIWIEIIQFSIQVNKRKAKTSSIIHFQRRYQMVLSFLERWLVSKIHWQWQIKMFSQSDNGSSSKVAQMNIHISNLICPYLEHMCEVKKVMVSINKWTAQISCWLKIRFNFSKTIQIIHTQQWVWYKVTQLQIQWKR